MKRRRYETGIRAEVHQAAGGISFSGGSLASHAWDGSPGTHPDRLALISQSAGDGPLQVARARAGATFKVNWNATVPEKVTGRTWTGSLSS